MNEMRPPSLATWLLKHTLGPRHDALAGDLLEEFRSGRSRAWYWRQTRSALAHTWFQSIATRTSAILFTLSLTSIVPAWLLAVAGVENRFNLHQRFHQMDWPWPFLCEWGLILSANLLFIWTAIALYLLFHLRVAGTLSLRTFSGGMRASLPSLLTLWAALAVLPANFIQRYGLGGSASAIHSILSVDATALFVRLPFFFAILCTLWVAASSQPRPRTKAR